MKPSEPSQIWLHLEDGSRFEGHSLGATEPTIGEVVFNTSMTGYQEMLTDPSYKGQILTFTFPLIGNYGIYDGFTESAAIQVRGAVVGWNCVTPSHLHSSGSLSEYLRVNGITAIAGVDTRALTKRLRNRGVMMGAILADSNKKKAAKQISGFPRYETQNVVREVSLSQWENRATDRLTIEQLRGRITKTSASSKSSSPNALKITVIDFGVKNNILRNLVARGCAVEVVSPFTNQNELKEMLKQESDGIILSPGPGDPKIVDELQELVTIVANSGKPVFGICLGHQALARAFGATTFKLPFGHRGGNQPVQDIHTGRVYITAQNHGYAVTEKGLSNQWKVTHRHLDDGTIEGMQHKNLPIMTIQYHAEASPGPCDSEYIFDDFMQLIYNSKTT